MGKKYEITGQRRVRPGTICQKLRDIYAAAESRGEQDIMDWAGEAYVAAKKMNDRLVHYQRTYEPTRESWRDGITIGFPYYNQPEMMARHLEEWATYSDEVKSRISAVIVDDGSAEPLRIDADPGFPVRVYRVLDDIPWNISGAKNLIMREAPDDWVLITDIDHVLTADNAAKMFAMFTAKRPPGKALKPLRMRGGKPYKSHITTMLVHRDDWWRCGGMDEDFAGHYGEGTPFIRNLAAVAEIAKTNKFALELVGIEDVADAHVEGLGRFGSEYDADAIPELRDKRHGGPYKASNPIRFLWKRVQ